MEAAERARLAYVEALRTELLQPLREQVEGVVSRMFPEISVASLLPAVPTISETLSSIGVELGDTASTSELKSKGTGVRSAVLLSLMQYLAEQSRRSLVLAVEEPEAFLHPGAQELIRSHLQQLAGRDDVSLFVTTHSPYVITRDTASSVTELRKTAEGGTEMAATVRADDSRTEILGSLFRDAGLAAVLERALEVPEGSRAVLITEGYTDGEFLRAACRVAGRPELLDGVHVMPANGAKKVVFQALLAQSATELPIVALLDMDSHGKAAQEKLEDFGWSKNREVLSLSAWPGRCGRGHDVEIEDLLSARVVEQSISRLGELDAVDQKLKCGERWHYSLSAAWKARALETLSTLLRADDVDDLIWLAEEVNRRIERVEQARARAAAHRRLDRGGECV